MGSCRHLSTPLTLALKTLTRLPVYAYLILCESRIQAMGPPAHSDTICVTNPSLTTSARLVPFPLREQNTDAGTMSPFEHGEVFVLDDGGEADLDLGNYERFLGVRLSRDHNITTGKVWINNNNDEDLDKSNNSTRNMKNSN